MSCAQEGRGVIPDYIVKNSNNQLDRNKIIVLDIKLKLIEDKNKAAHNKQDFNLPVQITGMKRLFHF